MFLYYIKVLNFDFFQVCVKNCPDTTIIFENEMAQTSFESLRSKMVCTDEVNVNTMTSSQALQYMREEKCARFLLASQPGM